MPRFLAPAGVERRRECGYAIEEAKKGLRDLQGRVWHGDIPRTFWHERGLQGGVIELPGAPVSGARMALTSATEAGVGDAGAKGNFIIEGVKGAAEAWPLASHAGADSVDEPLDGLDGVLELQRDVFSMALEIDGEALGDLPRGDVSSGGGCEYGCSGGWIGCARGILRHLLRCCPGAQ